jgi:hypothetical protein
MKNYIGCLDVKFVDEAFLHSKLDELRKLVSGEIIKVESNVVWLKGKRGKCKFTISNLPESWKLNEPFNST